MSFDVTDDVTPPQEAEAPSDVEDAPVVRFLQKMLIDAINARASDLHFEPYEYHYRVRFRIDGAMREVLTLPSTMAAARSPTKANPCTTGPRT